MHIAARWFHVDIAKYLADKGADINLKDSDEVILIIRITVDYSSNLSSFPDTQEKAQSLQNVDTCLHLLLPRSQSMIAV